MLKNGEEKVKPRMRLFDSVEETKRPLYIFDVDGTLALCEHRQHLLHDKEDKSCWDTFFLACEDDQPNTPIITILQHLKPTADILIWTGRSDLVRNKTVAWLSRHTDISEEDVDAVLTMAKDGEKIAAADLKKSWLLNLSPEDRYRLVAVFEDCNDVVAMWREMNVTCCQVQLSEY